MQISKSSIWAAVKRSVFLISLILLMAGALISCSTAPKLPQQRNSTKNQANDKRALGAQALLTYRVHEARGFYLDALELSQQVDHAPGVIKALIGLGDAAMRAGDDVLAMAYYKQAEQIGRQQSADEGLVTAMIRQSEVMISRRDSQQALSLLQGLDRKVESGSMQEALLLHAQGTALRLDGNYTLAASRLEEAEKIARQNDDLIAAAASLYQLASVRVQQGKLSDAAELLLQSLELDHTMENPAGIAASLEALAAVRARQERYDEAADCWIRAYAVYQAVGNVAGMRRAAEGHGAIAASTSHPDRRLEIESKRNVWEQLVIQ